jgi:hypothetical protein
VEMSQLTFSNKLPRLPKRVVQVEVPLQEELETYLEQLEQVQVVPELDLAISISSETTLNSNNFGKSFNKTLKCLNLSFNKLELVTHNWRL